MPEQDLQQWLNSLKKGAAPSSGSGGGQSSAPAPQPEQHRYASTHPSPQHVQRDPGSPHERPKQSGLTETIAESIAGSAGVKEAVSYFQQRVEKLRQMQEAMQQAPAQPRQAYRESEQRREPALQDEDALQQKEVIYQQIVSHARGTDSKPAGKTSRARTSAKAEPARQTAGRPQSALGLSGNLLQDLRNNPAALREAICLLEILGPPLSDRDPFERLV